MPSLTQIKQKLDLGAIRRKLEGAHGDAFWNSLEQIAATDDFRRYVEDEFPERAMDWADPSRRRTFLKLMGASLALAGLTACTKQPPEAIVPYVTQPEEIVPGKPLFYATAMPAPGGAQGVLVESHMGRPTKIEGNPNHPATLGATDAFTQASLLDLYDPDRSQAVTHHGQMSDWTRFAVDLIRARDNHAAQRGAGLTLLTPPVLSPTVGARLDQLFAALPQARWRQWDPIRNPSASNPIYRFDQAKVIVSLDSDFLSCGPASVRYARQFADGRRLKDGQPQSMNRLYVAEASVTNTGAMADHRLRMRAVDVSSLAAALASALGVAGVPSQATLVEPVRKAVPMILADLQANRGASVVIAGDTQPPWVHGLAHAMNESLGNLGHTVDFTAPVEYKPVDTIQSLRALIGDIYNGSVQTLLVLGCNPVYDAPADFGFADAYRKVPLRIHLGLYSDETAALSHWHVPQAHYLESWGDARAFDGTVTLMQPLIQPLYEGRNITDVIGLLADKSQVATRELVREHWQSQAGPTSTAKSPASNLAKSVLPGPAVPTLPDAFWQQSLHDGVVKDSVLPVGARPAFPSAPATVPPALPGTEVLFRPDPAVWDGTYSNNAWLQEMPRPQNKMVWDNAMWISPATAERLKVENEDLIEIAWRGRKVQGPAWVMPGHADESVTLHLGYGRTHGGHKANGVGFNAYTLRASDAMWNGEGADIRKAGGKHAFATTQYTYTMEGREPVKVVSLAEHISHPAVERETPPRDLTMYPEFSYDGYKWGMAIDLNACVGCQACTVACQAENNIPVVGKDQVSRGRHMNWLRVDRYFHGKLDDPELYYQPVPCMQCENAPCELVCPVGATVHSGDGLNQMVYNRCVGTRYCSNNCPYKVRRFNFYLYSDWYTESLYGMRNPDVTVRSRGVMEKCTYCVQRIAQAKIESEKADRRIHDGEIVTACAQACPTRAIVFGDLNDSNSQVALLKKQQRNYGLLEDLNTRPRTTYLARVRNPNSQGGGS